MRNRFDQLAKNILRDALQLLGTVETQAEVFSAPQAIDVWCVPDPARRAAGLDLGMLAQIEDCPLDEVRIGMPLEMTIGKIKTDTKTGKTVVGHKYRPVT